MDLAQARAEYAENLGRLGEIRTSAVVGVECDAPLAATAREKLARYVVVVVVSEPDAASHHWIITAYLTRRLAEGEPEWKRS